MEERDKLAIEPKPPLLVKISPDLTEKDKVDIAAVVARPKVCKRISSHHLLPSIYSKFSVL